MDCKKCAKQFTCKSTVMSGQKSGQNCTEIIKFSETKNYGIVRRVNK